MATETLYAQFNSVAGNAERFRHVLVQQFERLLSESDVTLGVPLESRVKTWNSIGEKIERKALQLNRIEDIDDLVGIRLILLFRTDLSRVADLLAKTFDVVTSEDTSSRLAENQFGYQSHHYVLRLPSSWSQVPIFGGLEHLRAEVQVRTLAQHIWAVASHKLQYKHEATVPVPLRRSINRVSALLETVDLEFERLLSDRLSYVHQGLAESAPNSLLNVDLTQAVLDEMLPARNKKPGAEKYAELLRDLTHFEIQSVAQLRELLSTQMTAVMESEEEHFNIAVANDDEEGTSPERLAAGVFFTHVGLTREALCMRFGGDAVRGWLLNNSGSDDDA